MRDQDPKRPSMPDVTWTHTFLDVFLHYVPRNVRSVLDAGCGRGIVGSLLKIYRNPERIVGIDLFDAYLDFCRGLGVYSDVRKHDLGTTPLPFADREFDLSIALEVIEHLPKTKGHDLLRELERISGMVIISTPNRYFHQTSYDDNRCQEHLSQWNVGDLRRRGYTVFGVGGLLVLGMELGYISYALGRLTLLFPRLSSGLMAVYFKGTQASRAPWSPRATKS